MGHLQHRQGLAPGDVEDGTASLDPITLELSLLFHSKGPLRGAGAGFGAAHARALVREVMIRTFPRRGPAVLGCGLGGLTALVILFVIGPTQLLLRLRVDEEQLAAECAWLIQLARNSLRRARIYRKDAEGYAEAGTRTNSPARCAMRRRSPSPVAVASA